MTFEIGDKVTDGKTCGTVMAHGKQDNELSVLWDNGYLSLEFPDVLRQYTEDKCESKFKVTYFGKDITDFDLRGLREIMIDIAKDNRKMENIIYEKIYVEKVEAPKTFYGRVDTRKEQEVLNEIITWANNIDKRLNILEEMK